MESKEEIIRNKYYWTLFEKYKPEDECLELSNLLHIPEYIKSAMDEYSKQRAIEWDVWKRGQHGLIFDGIHYVDRAGNVYTPSQLFQIFLTEKSK